MGKVIEGSYIGLHQNATGFVFSALLFQKELTEE
jgi:hypothetical protein